LIDIGILREKCGKDRVSDVQEVFDPGLEDDLLCDERSDAVPGGEAHCFLARGRLHEGRGLAGQGADG
jgi:hypothetical protein